MKLNEIERKVVKQAIDDYAVAHAELEDFFANGNVKDEDLCESYKSAAINTQYLLMGTIRTLSALHDVIFYYDLLEISKEGTLTIKYFEKGSIEPIGKETI